MKILRQPALIIFGGLPGTGKTTLSRELAIRLTATHLRIDAIEQALRDAGHTVGAGYVIANALAAENLKLRRIAGPFLRSFSWCASPLRSNSRAWPRSRPCWKIPSASGSPTLAS